MSSKLEMKYHFTSEFQDEEFFLPNILFFFRFPFNNSKVFKQWMNFVIESDLNVSLKSKQQKKISKYSSICSQHFLQSDFSQSQSRRFLRKNAVPSIKKSIKSFARQNEPEVEQVEIDMEDPLCDSCGLCKSTKPTLNNVVDDYLFGLIRKCLPLTTIHVNFFQKLCCDCVNSLNSFSAFIDKVMASQNVMINQNFLETEEVGIFVNPVGNIKVEPITNFENEPKTPSIQVINFTQQSPPSINRKLSATSFTPQKKCEILEIVDIKPFHSFDGSLQHEPYDDEDDIQILSPKQLKVELTDPDEDGSNELEQIRNYVFVSTVFLKDHNYTKTISMKSGEHNVKTEYDDDVQDFIGNCPVSNPEIKICHICHKAFRSFRKFLIHKVVFHKLVRSDKMIQKKIKLYTKNKTRFNRQKIRKICTKIIKRKKQKIEILSVKENDKKQCKRVRKSYNCPTCLKTFSGPKNLYQHKISHTVPSYTCNLCDKKFKRLHGLKQHVKSIHEKEKTHVCPICRYSYFNKFDMFKCRHSKLKTKKS